MQLVLNNSVMHQMAKIFSLFSFFRFKQLCKKEVVFHFLPRQIATGYAASDTTKSVAVIEMEQKRYV